MTERDPVSFDIDTMVAEAEAKERSAGIAKRERAKREALQRELDGLPPLIERPVRG